MKTKKTSHIVLRCTSKEKELLRSLAKEKGVNLTDYVKDKLFGRIIVLREIEKRVSEV